MTETSAHVEAIVFDLDGVLIDSEELWDQIRRSQAAQAGQPWPAGATRAIQGMSTGEWASYLCDVVGVPGTPTEVSQRVIAQMADSYRQELPLLPGAVDAVRRVAQRWPLALASSSPRQLIDAVLEATGLVDAFQVTLSTEEVPAGKPSPLVYLEAVARLGVTAGRTVGVEDSSNGLRAAHAAGLIVVAVPNQAFPPAADALALAAVQVSSVQELSVEFIESLGATHTG